MSTTVPMFLELEQEERAKELEREERNQSNKEEQFADLEQSESRESIVDVNPLTQREIRGKKLLLSAEKGRSIELVQRLHEDWTLIDYADPDGYTPLHRASYGGHVDCIKYLCRHGANIEARTTDDWRPIHCSVRWNNVQAAQYLLDQGSDVNAKSVGGNTPLHIAASNGRYSLTCDIIQMLLFHPNCDYYCKNQSGDTAYDLAKRSGPFYRLWVGVMTLFKNEEDR